MWHRLTALLALAMLAACSSVPLGTVLKLSRFSEADFVKLQAEQLRVRVRAERDVALDVAHSFLEFELMARGEPYESRLTLKLDSEAMDGPEKVYTMSLDERGAQVLADAQEYVAQHEIEDLDLLVKSPLRSSREKETSLSVDLLLDQRDGFFTLIDGYRVRVKPDAP